MEAKVTIIISICKQLNQIYDKLSLLIWSQPIHCHIVAGNRNLKGFLGVTHLGLLGILLPQILYIIGNGIKRCGEMAHLIIGQVVILPVYVALHGLSAAVKQAECPIAVLQRLEPILYLVLGLVTQSLHSQLVLVNCNDFLVQDDGAGLIGHLREVIAQNKRGCHHAPHAEMGAVLIYAHAVANLKHIGIVPVTRACVFAQRSVLVYDTQHRLTPAALTRVTGKSGGNIPGGTP